jgi:hypothetical protein
MQVAVPEPPDRPCAQLSFTHRILNDSGYGHHFFLNALFGASDKMRIRFISLREEMVSGFNCTSFEWTYKSILW